MNLNISDDELEKIFKQGTENAKFEYDPAAWTQMESLLDKDKKKRSIIIWTSTLLLTAIGLSLLLLLSPAKNNNKEIVQQDKDSKEIISNEKTTFESSKINDDSIINNKLESPLTRKTTPQQQMVEDEKFQIQKEKINLNKKTSSNSINESNSNIENSEKSKPLSSFDILNKNEPQTNTPNPFEQKEVNKANTQEQKTNEVEALVDNKNSRTHLNLELLPNKSSQVVWKEKKVNLPPIKISPSIKLVQKSERLPLLIAMSVGKRYTKTPATKFGNGDNIYNFGIGYGVNKKLAVQVSGSYTVDNYLAGYEDYFVYPGYWTRGIKPKSTKATCEMLNINLGMSYYLNSIGRSGPYGGIGLSSIYMLNEKYYYQISDPGSDVKRKWYGGGSEDLLSHLTFNAGYYLRLHSRFGLTVNGNYELPIYGIGHGHIKMSGLAVNVGTNIRLN
jgi:hypothetical protein